MSIVRILSLISLLAIFPVGDTLAAEVIESWPAKATDDHPRNSEGDTVLLKDGSLLVGWTEFQKSNTDFTPAHIAGRKSLDGGRTWGKQFVLQPNIGAMNTMSLSFLRLRDSAELMMFFLVKNSRTDLDVYCCRSSDEARTWSEPTLISPEPGYHVMNNARVVQLTSGRILCPVSTTLQIHSKDHPLKNVCYFSDDNGLTWRRGADAVEVPKRGAMEPGLIQRSDGTLLQIIRTQLGKIWITESTDEGDTWSPARPWNVVAPEAPSTLIPLPSSKWLLIHNPNIDANARSHGGRRTPLVARVSSDEGATWSEPLVLEEDLNKTYAYVSARVAADRVHFTYYVEENRRLSLKFKSLAVSTF